MGVVTLLSIQSQVGHLLQITHHHTFNTQLYFQLKKSSFFTEQQSDGYSKILPCLGCCTLLRCCSCKYRRRKSHWNVFENNSSWPTSTGNSFCTLGWFPKD